MNTLIVPDKEQGLILSAIDGLPPSQLLDGLNEEQAEHWYSVRQVFSHLHKHLAAYFSGESAPLLELSAYEEELYGFMSDFYIKLYGVIQRGWKDILKYYDQYGNKIAYGVVFPCKSPGETLAAILGRDAASMFFQCKAGRHDFKPRKMYGLFREAKKIDKGKLSNKQTLSDKQISNHEREVKTLTKDFNSLIELELQAIIVPCRLAAKKRKDKILTSKLKDYESSREQLTAILHRGFRSSKGYAWQNGKLLETTKKGGSYQ